MCSSNTVTNWFVVDSFKDINMHIYTKVHIEVTKTGFSQCIHPYLWKLRVCY